MGKQLKICNLCSAEYEVCKYNYSRQKYCRTSDCARQRKKLKNQAFQAENPDYFRERYRLTQISDSTLPEPAEEQKANQKRVLVNSRRLRELAQVFEKQLAILAGLVVQWNGGLAQASAFWVSDFLEGCYEKGRSLIKASSLNNNMLEIFNELTSQYPEPPP